MLADGLGRAGQSLLCFGTQIVLVIVKINVRYVLIEKLLFRQGRRWWRRRERTRLPYRYIRWCLLWSASPGRGQAVSSRLRCRNALSSSNIHPSSLYRHVSSVL